MKQTIQSLRALKQQQQKFTVVAAYDATFTRTLNQAGVDAILVGDSLGMVVKGQDSEFRIAGMKLSEGYDGLQTVKKQ